MVINKRAIDHDSGLRFKKSFHKFAQKILEHRLASYGGGLRVYVDEHGSREFMKGFADYLGRHIGGTLFFGYEQQFVNSEYSRLVQLADLVAGSLAYCYDDSKRCDETPQMLALLRNKQIDIAAWPPVVKTVTLEDVDDGQQDTAELMAVTAHNRAVRFLHTNEDAEDPLLRAQASVLEMLLFARCYEHGDDRSIFGAELLRRLEARGFESMSEQSFRSHVIGGLRDSGIVIAGTWHGYRLALSIGDIRDYLTHTKSVILPMLSRIGVARRSVLIDTAGRLDILQPEEHGRLRTVVECFIDGELMAALEPSDAAMADTDELVT